MLSPFLLQRDDVRSYFLEHIGSFGSLSLGVCSMLNSVTAFFTSGAVLLSVMSVQRRRNESVMSIVTKVCLSSFSLFLPQEGTRNALVVDLQSDPMVAFLYHCRAWSYAFSGRPAIGRLPR